MDVEGDGSENLIKIYSSGSSFKKNKDLPFYLTPIKKMFRCLATKQSLLFSSLEMYVED